MSISESSKGFVAITMAFSLLALCAFVGLAVDLGYFRYIKRDMQNAADAAAIGAAMAIANSESGEALGRADSARNGYTHGADGIVVSVNNPPAGGSFAGNNGYVQAVITQPQPTFFMGVVSFNSVDIAASATAYVQESGSGCIYVLDPTAKLAMTLTGGSTLDVGCDIYVNSDRGGPHRLDHLAAFLRWTPQFLLPPVREILRGGEPEGKVPLRMFFQASVHLLRRRPSVRRVRSLAVV